MRRVEIIWYLHISFHEKIITELCFENNIQVIRIERLRYSCPKGPPYVMDREGQSVSENGIRNGTVLVTRMITPYEDHDLRILQTKKSTVRAHARERE